MSQLYYDSFADEVVTEIDEITPPERYIRVHRGCDVFIEKWCVGDGRYLDIAYTPFDRKNHFDYSIRNTMEKNHNVRLQYITDWTVPEEHYKKMLRTCGSEMKGGVENEC